MSAAAFVFPKSGAVLLIPTDSIWAARAAASSPLQPLPSRTGEIQEDCSWIAVFLFVPRVHPHLGPLCRSVPSTSGPGMLGTTGVEKQHADGNRAPSLGRGRGYHMREAFGMTNFPSFSQARWKASRRRQEPERLLPAGVRRDGAAPGVAQQNTERRKSARAMALLSLC